MTSRERIRAIVNRQPVDRFPVDLWLTPEINAQLKRRVGVADDLDLYRAMGVDKVVWTWPAYKGPLPPLKPGATACNAWGVQTAPVAAGGHATYHESVFHPLAECQTAREVEQYRGWPDPTAFDLDTAADNARCAAKEFMTIGPWVSFFEIYCAMRGLETALMDVLTEPDLANAALDRIEAVQTDMMRRLFNKAGDTLDWVFVSDDMASQANLLMSPENWNVFILPRIRRWCEFIHAHGKKVFFHTDGAAGVMIPALIEAGIDILNPIQHACPGMDMKALKQRYGRKIIFHGGVDNQQVLPFGSPDDVRREVIRCLEILGEGRQGYICCSCHNIQAGTPIENVLALVETVKQQVPR